VVRIWDIFIVEGFKTIFRFGLAILKVLEKRIMQADMGEMFIIFKDFRTEANADLLIKTAINDFSFSKSLVAKYEKEFTSAKPNKEIAMLSKLL
jgi:hypothetical protein